MGEEIFFDGDFIESYVVKIPGGNTQAFRGACIIPCRGEKGEKFLIGV